MKYMFVARFSEKKYGDLDWIHALEDKLIDVLVDDELDGHDMGSGQVNFYIFTNNPRHTLEIVKNIFIQENVLADAKIAYRDVDGNKYTCLWPEGIDLPSDFQTNLN